MDNCSLSGTRSPIPRPNKKRNSHQLDDINAVHIQARELRETVAHMLNVGLLHLGFSPQWL
jgi:hypothetical protein